MRNRADISCVQPRGHCTKQKHTMYNAAIIYPDTGLEFHKIGADKYMDFWQRYNLVRISSQTHKRLAAYVSTSLVDPNPIAYSLLEDFGFKFDRPHRNGVVVLLPEKDGVDFNSSTVRLIQKHYTRLQLAQQ